MEQIVRSEVVQHLENNSLLSKHQHGFRKMRSCQSNLLECLEDWTKILDEGKGLDIIYLDYQKAFDTVPHERLTTKLSASVSQNFLIWMGDDTQW